MPKRKPKASTDPLAWIVPGLRPLAVELATLVPDPQNARKHSEANLKAIMASQRAFGQRKPLVVNQRNLVVVAGNGQLEAARRLGHTFIAVVWVDDDPATQNGYALADNRTAELAEWDDAKLAELLVEVKQSHTSLIEDLLWSELAQSADGHPGEDAAAPVQPVAEQWQVIVDCGSEEVQKKLWEEMSARGMKCR